MEPALLAIASPRVYSDQEADHTYHPYGLSRKPIYSFDLKSVSVPSIGQSISESIGSGFFEKAGPVIYLRPSDNNRLAVDFFILVDLFSMTQQDKND